MIIRNEQLQKILHHRREPFVRWATEHLERHFPEECLRRGAQGVRASIELGLERTEGYGITGGPEVARYLNLMFVFHDHFDRDPELPWAAEILRNPRLRNGAKLDSLLAHAEMALDGEAGEGEAGDEEAGEGEARNEEARDGEARDGENLDRLDLSELRPETEA